MFFPLYVLRRITLSSREEFTLVGPIALAMRILRNIHGSVLGKCSRTICEKFTGYTTADDDRVSAFSNPKRAVTRVRSGVLWGWWFQAGVWGRGQIRGNR